MLGSLIVAMIFIHTNDCNMPAFARYACLCCGKEVVQREEGEGGGGDVNLRTIMINSPPSSLRLPKPREVDRK